jgi:hypothetical protein
MARQRRAATLLDRRRFGSGLGAIDMCLQVIRPQGDRLLVCLVGSLVVAGCPIEFGQPVVEDGVVRGAPQRNS